MLTRQLPRKGEALAVIEDATVVRPRGGPGMAAGPGPDSLLQAIFRQRRIFLGTALAVIALATIIVLSLASQYESEALVLYDAAARNPADIRDNALAGGRAQTDLNDVRSQLKIITSPQLAREVLTGLSAADREVLDRPSLIGRLATLVGAGARPPAADGLPDDKAVGRYLDRLTAFNDGRSFVVEVAFRSASAELSQRVLARHVEAFLAQQLAAQKAVIHQAEQWFDSELERLRERLVAAEARQQAFRQRSDLLLAEGETLRSRQLASITRALAEVRFDLARKSARHAELGNGSARAVADSSAAASELIQKLREQEADVSRQVASMSQQFGPSYPPLAARRAELVEVQARIETEVARLGTAAGADVEIARKNVARLEGELEAAIKALGASSQDELSALQVERDIRADRQVYDRLLERSREVAVQGLLQPLEFRVVSAPTLAGTAVAPKRALLLLLALPLSLFVGLAAALMAQWQARRRVASLSLLEQHYGLYGLGALPDLALGRRTAAPVTLPPVQATQLISGIQSLRNSLVFQNDGRAPRSLVFSSALPGDGKTATATLYARSIAMAGERVLLIDADLRRQSLSKSMLTTASAQGLIDCLRGLALDQAVVANRFPRLDLLPAGSAAGGATELLDHRRVQAFLEACLDRYPVVIIDTPPLCAVDDASVWSNCAETTVLVAKWRVTPTGALLDAARRVDRAGGRLAGIVLSATDIPKYLAQEGQALSGQPYPAYPPFPADSPTLTPPQAAVGPGLA